MNLKYQEIKVEIINLIYVLGARCWRHITLQAPSNYFSITLQGQFRASNGNAGITIIFKTLIYNYSGTPQSLHNHSRTRQNIHAKNIVFF